MIEVPVVVANKARAAGADRWLAEVGDLIAELSNSWGLTTGTPFPDATEALVLPVTLAGRGEAILKLLIPRDGDHRAAREEATVLRLAGGQGCAELLRADTSTGALLLERLGPSLADLELPIRQRHDILCAAAQRLWRPATGTGLPTGAAKGRWLIGHITTVWEELGRPCLQAAVDHALVCAERRIAAHDDDRAVLVHGDVHQWNVLVAGPGYKLIDPDGLVAEAEYDLGIIMREDPAELDGDGWDRAHQLADWCNLDPVATWEWGVVERVSTGLLCTRIDLQPVGRHMLAAAERVAASHR